MKVVLDTNILVSALVKDSYTRRIITLSRADFFVPEEAAMKIFEHKRELVRKSGLHERDFLKSLFLLFKHVNMVPEADFHVNIREACGLIGAMDKDDVSFLAAAISIGADFIWSNDNDFKKQSRIRALTTAEIQFLVSRGEI